MTYQVIGGVAINAHLLPQHADMTAGTQDVDLLMRRADLEKAIKAAEVGGYQAKKITGGYMFIRALPDELRARWEDAKRQFAETLPDVEQPD